MSLIEDMKRVYGEYQTGDRNISELAVGEVAANARAANRALATILDYMVPDFLGVGESFQKGAEYLANTQAGQFIGEKAKEIQKEYPVASRMFGELVDIGSVVPAGRVAMAKRAPEMRGQLLSEGDVIIPGYYQPKDVSFGNRIEDYIKKQEEKYAAGNRNPVAWALGKREGAFNPKVDAFRKATGFVQWGLESGARGLRSTYSPEARAMYAAYGINQIDLKYINKWKRAQEEYDRVKELSARGEATAEQLSAARREMQVAKNTAQQQLQATANIRTQAGNTGARVTDELDASVRDAVDPGVLSRTGTPYFSAKRSDDWYHEIVAPSLPNADLGDFSRVDSNVIQRHIYNAQKPKDDVKFIVKRASSAETGKHWEDLFHGNKKLDPVADAFADLYRTTGRWKFKDNAEMMRYLSNRQEVVKDKTKLFGKKEGNNFTIKFDDPNAVENSNGIWISTSKVGTAKTEGGINTLYRVDLDGSLIGVMNDKHDFLDKIFGIKQILSGNLPTDVIALTAPVRYDIFSARKARFKQAQGVDANDLPEIIRETGKKKVAGDISVSPAVSERLQRMSELTPPSDELARQRGKAAVNVGGTGLGMFGVVDQMDWEENVAP